MIFLRFQSREQFRKLAAAEGLLTDDGDIITASHTHAIDEIGLLYRGGSYDPETGEQLEPPEQLPGWHVNFIGTLPEAWAPFTLQPLHTMRVFAPGPAPEQPAWPANPQRFTRWTDPSGTEWIYDQPRNPDGTYMADDPTTPEQESALQWLVVGGTWEEL